MEQLFTTCVGHAKLIIQLLKNVANAYTT